MLKTRIIPTILVRDVGLVKGRAFDSWRNVGAPMQAVRVYNRREVDELVLLDIEATPSGRPPDFALIAALARECFVPLSVGGGIRSVNDVRELLRAGADKVCLNTSAYDDPGLIQQAASMFGVQCVTIAIDVHSTGNGKYECYKRCGTVATGRNPVEWARFVESKGAGEILLTSIERDGCMNGYDLDLIRQVSEAVRVPVIASGGAGEYEHMRQAVQEGRAAAVAASSMFLFTQATPREAKAYLAACGIPVRNEVGPPQ